MFERLRQFLANPDTLLLSIGFSFRDAHISADVEESLATNANAAAIASTGEAIANALGELKGLDRETVRRQRRDKFLAIGRNLE